MTTLINEMNLISLKARYRVPKFTKIKKQFDSKLIKTEKDYLNYSILFNVNKDNQRNNFYKFRVRSEYISKLLLDKSYNNIYKYERDLKERTDNIYKKLIENSLINSKLNNKTKCSRNQRKSSEYNLTTNNKARESVTTTIPKINLNKKIWLKSVTKKSESKDNSLIRKNCIVIPFSHRKKDVFNINEFNKRISDFKNLSCFINYEPFKILI